MYFQLVKSEYLWQTSAETLSDLRNNYKRIKWQSKAISNLLELRTQDADDLQIETTSKNNEFKHIFV